MPLVLNQRIHGRRAKRLEVDADIFLRLLSDMDGVRRIRTDGLPEDVRCVGLATNELFNTITLWLESAEWPEVEPGCMPESLFLRFTEFYGAADPVPAS